MPRRLALCLTAAAALACAAAAWFFLAPAQLGGGTSFAVVYGTSMEPHFHRGDLVVLRRRASYHVGEVVGYHSAQLHREVLHRIVAERGGRVTFKGDNNSFLDPEHVRTSQLFGREWLRVPGAGAQLERLRSPWVAALVAGLAALLLLGGSGATARRRRPRSPRATPVRPAMPRPAPGSAAGAVAVVGALGLAVSLALALVAFTRPASRTVTSPDQYVKRGVFAYSARVPVGPVYHEPVLRAPAPVYLKLVHGLDVSFAYSTRAKVPANLSGTGQLELALGDGAGWRRSFVLQAPQAFDGTQTTLRGRVDLRALGALIRRFEAQTGEHNTLYKLELRPQVVLQGTVAGRAVKDVFAPSLTLDLDQLRLQPAQPADGAGPNTLVRAEGAAGTRREASTLSAFGARVTIARARGASAVAAGCALCLLLLGGLPLLRRDGGEVGSIRRRYGDRLVEIAPGERPAGAERRVASMNALALIADRYERLILHEPRPGFDSFLVEDDGIVYRHDVVHAPPAAEEPEQLFGWAPGERPRPLAEDRL
jgi:signal peptidase I